MQITITGSPKEIAALAVETQRRQLKLNMALRASQEMDGVKAMKKGIALLKLARSGGLDPSTPASE